MCVCALMVINQCFCGGFSRFSSRTLKDVSIIILALSVLYLLLSGSCSCFLFLGQEGRCGRLLPDLQLTPLLTRGYVTSCFLPISSEQSVRCPLPSVRVPLETQRNKHCFLLPLRLSLTCSRASCSELLRLAD